MKVFLGRRKGKKISTVETGSQLVHINSDQRKKGKSQSKLWIDEYKSRWYILQIFFLQ